jgi:hypothetical protein
MLPGSRDATGAVYIIDSLPEAPGASFNGGLLVEPDGKIHVSSFLLPQVFPNGFGARNDGKLCIAYGGVIAGYNQGLPIDADGRLVCQLNQPASPGDAFVGGIRVGVLGGVYVAN